MIDPKSLLSDPFEKLIVECLERLEQEGNTKKELCKKSLENG